MGTTDIVDYGVLCKNITKPTESSLQNKEYSVVVLEEPRKQTIEKKKKPHPTLCFQLSEKVGHSDPKNKYHALNSVYYIFSIQVYITFLSIQVNIITHCPIVFFRLYLFRFKVQVNFGSQCFCFIFLESVERCCNMSTLLCVGGLQQRGGNCCSGRWGQVT